jgi:hypothetical protein
MEQRRPLKKNQTYFLEAIGPAAPKKLVEKARGALTVSLRHMT